MQRLCTRGVLRTSASSHYVYRRATLNWNLPLRIGDRRYPYFSRPSPGTSSPPDMTMPTAWPELDLDSIEKLREEELDEARVIQSGILPTQPLRVGGITFSHEFQPAAPRRFPDIPLSSSARPHHSTVASFGRRNAQACVTAGRRMSSSEGCGNPSRSISRNQR